MQAAFAAFIEWYIRVFMPFYWCDRENAKNMAQWEMDCIAAKERGERPPWPPLRWVAK